MKLFSLEEFSSRRRGAQDKYAKALAQSVGDALRDRNFSPVLSLAGKMFTEAYQSDTDAAMNKPAFNDFIDSIEKALNASTESSDPSATSLMIALAALNASAIAAADADDAHLELEWVDMDDQAVRATHREANGQTVAPGVNFKVGGAEMPYPGWTGAPIEEWINCRCVLRPVDAAERMSAALLVEAFSEDDGLRAMTPALVAALETMRSAGSGEIGEELFADAMTKGMVVEVGLRPDGAILFDLNPEVQTFADSGDHSGDTSLVVVALPAADDPVHGIGDEQKHVTLAYLGDFDGDPQAVHAAVENVAAQFPAKFTGAVNGRGQLGEHPGAETGPAKVWLVESPEIQGLRDTLTAQPPIADGLAASADSQHPHFIPHMTVDYADELPPEAGEISEITFDRLSVWQGDQQTDYPLGLAVPEAPPLRDVAAAVDDEPTIEPADPEPSNPRVAPLPNDADGIPVHGVLAPEGTPSGDGRGFRDGALSNRPLPLPGTYQSKTADGHDSADLVFMIEKVQVIDGLQHWSGHMRTTPEADAALGVLVDFGGRFGLSVDADSAVGEYDETEDITWFSEARSSGAAMVNIPAFIEAYIAVGPHPILDAETYVDSDPDDLTEDAPVLVAGGAFLERAVQQFKDLAPGVTEDGPGWLTHPVDTDRLRDYWVAGEGAAKIAWGVAGDFNRCRVNLAEYIKPEFLNGYCANRHYDALHVWPGQEAATRGTMEAADGAAAAPSVSLVAAGGWAAPSSWFDEQEELKAGPMGVKITDEGQTYGYIATWGECHIGLPGACTSPPTSDTDYGYFKTGMVPTREGGFVEVGQLTIGGGHASPNLGYRGAVAHYDATSAVWADVNIGENEIGIWFAGSVRPNISEDLLYAARASGRLSGDWREVHGNLEMCAALSVNVPGFPIPKVSFAVKNGRQTALVAAGALPAPALEQTTTISGNVAPGAITFSADMVKAFASEIARALDERETIKELRTAIERD